MDDDIMDIIPLSSTTSITGATSTPAPEEKTRNITATKQQQISSQKKKRNHYDLFVLIRITPSLRDAGELTTIVNNSLRILFGECQGYKADVLKLMGKDKKNVEMKEYAILQTDYASIDSVCAALTLATPPSFMNEYYRLDVIQIEDDLECIQTKN